MQVKMMGFKLEGDPNYPINALFDKLRAFDEKKHKSYTLFIRLSSSLSEGYFKGLIMYSTHNKTEHELVGKEIRKVDILNNRVRANYFVVDPVTGHGVYQAYFGSTSPKEFGNTLDWQYGKAKRDGLKIDIKSAQNETERKELRARSKHSKPIKVVWMVSDSDYLKIAESMKSIDVAEVDLEGDVREFEKMTGISAVARKRRLIYIFKDGTKKAAILTAVKTFSDMVIPEKIRLYGKMSDKLNRVLESDDDNIDYLDVLPFDEIAHMMVGNIDEFENHKITDELVKLAQKTF